MPLRLWRSGRFIAANVTGLVYFVAFFAVLYFYSVDLQYGRGYSVLATGLSFLPLTLIVAVLGPIAGRLTGAFGAGPVMVAGLAVAAVGCALMALAPHDTGLVDLQWRFAVVGIGSGLISSPTSTAAVSGVLPADSGSASAVYRVLGRGRSAQGRISRSSSARSGSRSGSTSAPERT